MMKPSLALLSEIKEVGHMKCPELKERYADLLGSGYENCDNHSVLRGEVIYKLQERFYGLGLTEEMVETIEKIGEPEAKKSYLLAGTRIVRRWKGEDHQVVIREDGKIEYAGQLYNSLSAVARKITGTNWNGKLFFGIKR